MTETEKTLSPEENLLRTFRTTLEGVTDYTSAAEAISTITTAAYRYAVDQTSATDIQEKYAQRQFLKEVLTNGKPFAILEARTALYPVFHLEKLISRTLDSWSEWLSDEAFLLLKTANKETKPSDIKHWLKLIEDHAIKKSGGS